MVKVTIVMDKDLTADIDIARSAARDAANEQMHKAGRTAWNRSDYMLAVRTFNQLTQTAPAGKH